MVAAEIHNTFGEKHVYFMDQRAGEPSPNGFASSFDKVFHICIHGDRNKIERGEDECGRKVYKIYYDQELQSRQKDLYSVPSAARACAIRSLSRSGS